MLAENDWLPHARKLAVGMKMRIRHGREGRPNMIVANERDRWWSYCQKCKDGGVMQKEHVLLNAPTITQAAQLVRPVDLCRVEGSDFETVVGRFLASKGMMFPYLPFLFYSESAKRMLLQDDAQRWHGRDLTGRSDRKWLNYDHAQFVGIPGDITVLTEDLFSMYKIRFALRDWSVHVCCTLGAGIHDYAALALKNCKHIVWAYDADKAGDDGFKNGRLRMRAFGPTQTRARPPEGLDPKDMDCEPIRQMITEAL